MLLLMFAGWVNRHQLDVNEYLQEENRVLWSAWVGGAVASRMPNAVDSHEKRKHSLIAETMPACSEHLSLMYGGAAQRTRSVLPARKHQILVKRAKIPGLAWRM